MTGNLAKTPLHAWHASHGGRMVDFAGWSMPVQYGSIVEEHQATRSAVGLFDVSHMGRLRFDGPDAGTFLDQLVSRRVVDLPVGHIRYALMTNEQGGILDDVLVYHLAAGDTGHDYYLMVVNASNRPKIVQWIQSRQKGQDVRVTDRTHDLAMIAVQGPKSLPLLDSLIDVNLAGMKYYRGQEVLVGRHPAIVSRTGYTGEDGFELMLPSDGVEALWQLLLERGQEAEARPVGLAARDTLRLEAGMPLYGHELTEATNPLQAGLEFAVDLEGRDFPGSEQLRQIQTLGVDTCRVGLELDGKRVPREHYAVLADNKQVGEVTSGTFSPTFERPLAMAYVAKEAARLGTELQVDIRGTVVPAKVVKLPFYRRAKA